MCVKKMRYHQSIFLLQLAEGKRKHSLSIADLQQNMRKRNLAPECAEKSSFLY